MDAADEKKPVRVAIFNQTYTVLTSGNPADTLQLAQQVDDLMSQIARRAGNLDATRTAVLACLHLADQLRGTERDLAMLRETIDRRSRDCALLLDQVLAGSSPR